MKLKGIITGLFVTAALAMASLTAVFAEGDPAVPMTGDTTEITPFVIGLVVALAALIVILIFLNRKKKK